jgi:hypothetical protein
VTQTSALTLHIAALRKVYSITSSAVASGVAGTVRPSAFAPLEVDYEFQLGRRTQSPCRQLRAYDDVKMAARRIDVAFRPSI